MTQTISLKREASAMDPQKLIRSQCELNIKTVLIFFLLFRYVPVALMLLQFLNLFLFPILTEIIVYCNV